MWRTPDSSRPKLWRLPTETSGQMSLLARPPNTTDIDQTTAAGDWRKIPAPDYHINDIWLSARDRRKISVTTTRTTTTTEITTTTTTITATARLRRRERQTRAVCVYILVLLREWRGRAKDWRRYDEWVRADGENGLTWV